MTIAHDRNSEKSDRAERSEDIRVPQLPFEDSQDFNVRVATGLSMRVYLAKPGDEIKFRAGTESVPLPARFVDPVQCTWGDAIKMLQEYGILEGREDQGATRYFKRTEALNHSIDGQPDFRYKLSSHNPPDKWIAKETKVYVCNERYRQSRH